MRCFQRCLGTWATATMLNTLPARRCHLKQSWPVRGRKIRSYPRDPAQERILGRAALPAGLAAPNVPNPPAAGAAAGAAPNPNPPAAAAGAAAAPNPPAAAGAGAAAPKPPNPPAAGAAAGAAPNPNPPGAAGAAAAAPNAPSPPAAGAGVAAAPKEKAMLPTPLAQSIYEISFFELRK